MKADATVTRRADPRVPASAVPSITGLRLSPGGTVALVNISRSGMLVEGGMRLAPNTRVVVSVEGPFTPPRIEGAVVRCQVASIGGGTVRYQFAIQFRERLDAGAIEGEPTPEPEAAPAEPPAIPEMAPARPRAAVNRW